MCGIAGLINSGLSRDELEKVLRGLERDLFHRGPDDGGVFVSRDGRCGLVNRRLAILDLSPAGHQPMTSADGRYTIVFNGEIYNFRALRDQLTHNGEQITSNSDTEVVLALFRQLGPKCLELLDGMFAIAIWDELEQSLFLARDPLGIKPLYYHQSGRRLLFASELRALLQTGLVPQTLSPAALQGYLLTGSVPEPNTLVEDVKMLPAGHHLMIRNGESELTKFWDLSFGNAELEVRNAERGGRALSSPSLKEGGLRQQKARRSAGNNPNNQEPITDNYAAIVRAALDDSVRRHHVSDVPVGIFLSGGIDSTAVLALSAQMAKRDLRTFSISFDNPKFDEGSAAEKTAQHFGAQHTDWRLGGEEAKQLLDEFIRRSDQPSVDGFNTFCVSKLAHDQGLKVVLSGLGGDEIFGGYQSFQMVPRMVQASERLGAVPPLRTLLGGAMQFAASSPRVGRLGYFLRNPPSTTAAYAAMRGIFTPQEARRIAKAYGVGDAPAESGPALPGDFPTAKDEVSYLELTRYMRNQLLRDSDVMSMAWSLELRVPLVDRKLLEAVARIPAAVRLASGKQLLLDAVPEIPEWIRSRPKQGFTFPFEEWVTTQWRDVFGEIEARSPVQLRSWYRTWCLFALEAFMGKLR